MSVEASQAVLRYSKLVGTQKLTLIGIADHANKKGVAWPSVETLAGYCNVSRQSIFNALNAAKKAGELEIDYKKGPHGCNIYRLNMDKLSNNYVKPQSSQLYSQASLTVKPALQRQSSQLDETVKPALHEPSITINEPSVVAKPKRIKPKSPLQIESSAMFSALADVTKTNLPLITGKGRGALNQAEKKMRDNGYTPQDVEAFGRWWYANDWRGKKGDPPTLQQVRSEWGKFKANGTTPSTKKADPEYDRKVAMLLQRQKEGIH